MSFCQRGSRFENAVASLAMVCAKPTISGIIGTMAFIIAFWMMTIDCLSICGFEDRTCWISRLYCS